MIPVDKDEENSNLSTSNSSENGSPSSSTFDRGAPSKKLLGFNPTSRRRRVVRLQKPSPFSSEQLEHLENSTIIYNSSDSSCPSLSEVKLFRRYERQDPVTKRRKTPERKKIIRQTLV